MRRGRTATTADEARARILQGPNRLFKQFRRTFVHGITLGIDFGKTGIALDPDVTSDVICATLVDMI